MSACKALNHEYLAPGNANCINGELGKIAKWKRTLRACQGARRLLTDTPPEQIPRLPQKSCCCKKLTDSIIFLGPSFHPIWCALIPGHVPSRCATSVLEPLRDQVCGVVQSSYNNKTHNEVLCHSLGFSPERKDQPQQDDCRRARREDDVVQLKFLPDDGLGPEPGGTF